MFRRFLAAAFLLTAAAPAWAADANELRTFAVTVDGKPSGTTKMAVRVDADGSETVATVAAIKVRIAVFSYTYDLQSHEVWKGGKLVSLETTANDDGKRKSVKAATADGVLTVTANGRARRVGADVITSTGWRHPGPTDKARDIVVLDTENGTEIAARLDPLPAGKVAVSGAVVEAQRFRVTGKKLDAVWWFDAAGRPVRQEMKEDGRTIVLELTSITR